MPSEIKPGDLPNYDVAAKLTFEGITTIVMTNIIAVVPLFGVSGFNLIITSLVRWVLKFAWEPLINFGAFLIIDAQQRAKAQAYSEAIDELERVIKKPDVDLNSEEVKKAHEEFKKKLADLIRLKPS